MNTVKHSDGELIYMIRCGNQEAFQIFFNKYINIIRKYIISFLKDVYIYGIEYEDLVQECSLTFYDVLLSYNEERGNFYLFLTQCIRYRLYDILKQVTGKKNVGFNYKTSTLSFEENEDCYNVDKFNLEEEMTQPKNYYLLQETTSEIFGNDSPLTQQEKIVTSLKIMGYSVMEIATKIGKSRKNVDYIIRCCKKKIKDNYQNRKE